MTTYIALYALKLVTNATLNQIYFLKINQNQALKERYFGSKTEGKKECSWINQNKEEFYRKSFL